MGEPGTGGSSTPSMVGAVKRWQKADPHKSQETWKNIAEANSTLEAQLRQLQQLSETHREAYINIIGICSHHTYGRVTSNAVLVIGNLYFTIFLLKIFSLHN